MDARVEKVSLITRGGKSLARNSESMATTSMLTIIIIIIIIMVMVMLVAMTRL